MADRITQLTDSNGENIYPIAASSQPSVIASATTLGGVKVGNNLTISGDGTLSATPTTLYGATGTNTNGAMTQKATTDAIENSKLAKTEILNMIYPVGSIYMSVNNVSPQSFLGGTWAVFAQGQTLVGVNPSDSDFSSSNSSGGAKTVTLSISQIPRHGHRIGIWNSNNSNYTAAVVSEDGTYTAAAGAGARNTACSWQSASFKTAGASFFDGSGDIAGNAHFVGGGGSHNNMPPYITVYMWRRTS